MDVGTVSARLGVWYGGVGVTSRVYGNGGAVINPTSEMVRSLPTAILGFLS
jgi:hypothetical protein